MLQYELQQVLCKRVRGIVASLLSSNKRQLVAILERNDVPPAWGYCSKSMSIHGDLYPSTSWLCADVTT